MGMFDRFILPEYPGKVFQTKDFALDLDWYTLDADRRIQYLHSVGHEVARRDPEYRPDTYTGTIELTSEGDRSLSYRDSIELVARVRDGYVGRFFPSFHAMREYDERHRLFNRRGQRKRHVPKKREPYISKARREKARAQAMIDLGVIMSEQLLSTINRQGFARRILGGIKEKPHGLTA